MAAGIAHEVNNPMAIISSTVLVLRKQHNAGKLRPEVLSECLDDIDATITRVTNIIKGMRNISRDTSNEGFAPAQLSDIFSDVFSICREKFHNHDVALTWDQAQLDSKGLECRRVQLSQVLINLLSNAFDAIKDQKGDKWIKVEVLDEGESYKLLLSDSGTGIPAEIQQKIFQPFFTTKEIGKGTGLGLSLSKSIIEQHGGSLSINNDVPFTQFVITLPVRAQSQAA